MAFSTLPNTLDDEILYTLTDMNHRVYTLVNETYDLLDLFIENPKKQLDDFANTRTVLVDEGKGKPKQARFVPVKNDREQLKAIFKKEVEKQKIYFLDELKMAQTHCLDQLAHSLTLPLIAANPQNKNPQIGQIRSLVEQREASQRKFQELVNQFLNETNHNLKQFKAKFIEDDNLPNVDTQFLNAQEFKLNTKLNFNEFERCDETKTTMTKSNELFSEALDQLFTEMKTFLSDRIDNDLQFFIVRN